MTFRITCCLTRTENKAKNNSGAFYNTLSFMSKYEIPPHCEHIAFCCFVVFFFLFCTNFKVNNHSPRHYGYVNIRTGKRDVHHELYVLVITTLNIQLKVTDISARLNKYSSTPDKSCLHMFKSFAHVATSYYIFFSEI